MFLYLQYSEEDEEDEEEGCAEKNGLLCNCVEGLVE